MALPQTGLGDEWDTDEEFLAWLWHELYPNELVPKPDLGVPD
jgi:hypothetical protein